MKTIGVVTTNRADYGIYRPILARLREEPGLETYLIVAGTHLSAEHGLSVREIEKDGHPIFDRLEVDLSDDSPKGVGVSTGRLTALFSESFAKRRPDILLVLGDRFEMHAAGVAAQPFVLPVAHVHGGEITEGAIDNALRHSLTKLSHLHFATTQEHADRIIQMGEEPWRVVMSGAPSLDNLKSVKLFSPDEIKKRYELPFNEPPLLVTFHPVTLEADQWREQAGAVLTALKKSGKPVVVTAPNIDTFGRRLYEYTKEWVDQNPNTRLVPNLGTQGYFSLMSWASAMVGNSSSGIIEAPSFGLPVVNVGNRQKGRVRGKNVIDVPPETDAILSAISKALDPEFRDAARKGGNPYGNGSAAESIVKKLKDTPVDQRLLIKRFEDRR